jgi:hypothetical protein
MKTIIAILTITTFFRTCGEDRRVYYSDNAITITRVDKMSRSYFYLGRYRDEQELPSVYIVSRVNEEMEAYLIFSEDHSVEMIVCGGKFKAVGEDNDFYISKKSRYRQSLYLDDHRENYGHMIKVDGYIKNEKELNKSNKSLVDAEYIER